MDIQREIDAETLQTWLEEGRALEVVDIRPQADFEAWHVPGSRNVDAYRAIHANSPGLLADYQAPEDRPVVTVCFVGQTSKVAARYLRSRGIEALTLSGGMQGWSLAWNTAGVLTRRGAQVIQLRRTGKGCLSYLVGSAGEAVVIDPSLGPDVYLERAAERGWRITGALDTHVHADHLSRGRALAAMAGADYHLPENDRVAFEYNGLRDADEIDVGEARLKAIHTPGHTFESMSYLLDEEALFSGDTLFLDSVGRPDLNANPDEAQRRAHSLYGSLQQLLTMPPETLILPGHASQPIAFDGLALAAPLAQVRQQTALLSLAEADFVDTLLKHFPDTPPNHLRIVELNEAGRIPDEDASDLEAGANRCAIG